MAERLVHVYVPAEREYPKGVAGEDYNKVARVVVLQTGFLGRGEPVFLGLVSEFGSENPKPVKAKVVKISGPTKMWYPYGETSAEAVVAGRRVQNALITPSENPVELGL